MKPISFSDLPLAEAIQRAIQAEGYVTPTPIQAETIPHLLEGRDVLGCAQTGTGKTAAFALPVLHRLETERQAAVSGSPRVLVLSPTRELADQIGNSFKTYGQHVRYRQAVIYGGVNQTNQVRALKRGAHLAVATPGRLLDLMDQGHIRLGRLEMFVLDEADRMLDMGFMPALKQIIACLPQNRQSLFFSATLPPQISSLAASLLRNPAKVDVSPKSVTVEQIEQRVLFVQQADKQRLLEQLLRKTGTRRALVFTRTKHGADRVAKHLGRGGFRTDSIHGNKTQNYRTRALNGFRNGYVQVLVATDVAARGIDVDGITHVINFDLPMEPENYVHRIGRTGRAGADGIALSFCDSSERSKLRAIENLIRTTIRIEKDHEFHKERTSTRETRPEPRGRSRDGQYGRGGPKGRYQQKRRSKARA